MHVSPLRTYRTLSHIHADEQIFQVVVEETDIRITLPKALDTQLARNEALQCIRALRNTLKLWMNIIPEFQHSLTPLSIPENAPVIIKDMSTAAQQMGVGPFAAVAGAVAQGIAGHLVQILNEQALPLDVIVENGGDLFLYSSKPRVIALLPNPHEQAMIGLSLQPEDFPLSVCASSATIGHSLSFGQGDLALVRAKSGALADAGATAYGNLLKGPQGIDLAIQQAQQDAAHGIEGVFFQAQGQIGAWGLMELTVLSA